MKSMKMFGFAALAALLAMALVGASSATATSTRLCLKDEDPCATKNIISHVHEESIGKATLLSSAINVECNVLFLGDVLAGTSAPLVVHGAFTYTNCNSGCVVTEENGPAEIKTLKTGTEEAEITGEGLVHVNCSGFINCRYNGVGLKGEGFGGLASANGTGEISLNEQTTNKENGFLCPATAKLDIETAPLHQVYIRAGGGTMECVSRPGGLYKTNAGGGVCSNQNAGLNETGGQWELVN